MTKKTKIYSKVFNKTDREKILKNVRDYATDKWDSTAAGKRLPELEALLNAEVHKKQAEDVPEEDRRVLEKYSCARTLTSSTISVRYNSNNNSYVLHHKYFRAQDTFKATLTISYYVVPSDMFYGSRVNKLSDEAAILEFLQTHHRIILDEWFELYKTRVCEIDKYVDAWGTLLANFRSSSKLLAAYPEVKKFLPPSILKFTPSAAGQDSSAVDEAKSTLAAFG